MDKKIQVEEHPFPPFLPEDAAILMLGTFPPKPGRWSMNFFYPNKINDYWRIMGLIFYNDKNHFWNDEAAAWKVDDIKAFLTEKKIAMWDTAAKVRRMKDNASDKFLDIVETIDLQHFFNLRPSLRAIVTTGEKASSVIAELTSTEVPAIGTPVECCIGNHSFTHYRMPSTSRAYPLSLEKKTATYRNLFVALGYEL
jgi:G:T/U-mismatch repair DNA glycosylase